MTDKTFCPACPPHPEISNTSTVNGDFKLVLSIPDMHCSSCMSKVEKALLGFPDVIDSRVNLSLKRVIVASSKELEVHKVRNTLRAIGFESYELDETVLHEAESDAVERSYITKLAVTGFAMMNVMLLSIAVWSGADGITRDMFHWISAAIAFPATMYGSTPFLTSAIKALKARTVNMDVPIVIAIFLALFTSLWETSLSGEHAYFDAAIALTFFLLIGRYLDHRARSIARSAANELAALEVKKVKRVDSTGLEETVLISEVNVGDILRVNPGGRIPLDASVVEGETEIDRSILTGETIPEKISIGSKVNSGELNILAPILLRIDRLSSDSMLQRVMELVAVAESGRSNYTSMADTAAKLYAPLVHLAATITFLIWLYMSGDVRVSLNIAASVLIITCPCALGLAVPAVTTVASGILFKKGVLIKSETALERLSLVDTVVFDKTGTLTKGILRVTDDSINGLTELQKDLMFTLAKGSDHPFSRAISAALSDRNVVSKLNSIKEVPGFGIQAEYRNNVVRLGRVDWVTRKEEVGLSVAFSDGFQTKVLHFEDEIRANAKRTIKKLKEAKFEVILLSGDNEDSVKSVAHEVGITSYYFRKTPEDKINFIGQLKDSNRNVLMVGDGLNDTGALTLADVSIAPSKAIDASRVASDMIFMKDEMLDVASIIELSHHAKRRIKENFNLSLVYNIIAVPVAVVGLLTPLIAAIAMSSSSILVTLNALRLK